MKSQSNPKHLVEGLTLYDVIAATEQALANCRLYKLVNDYKARLQFVFRRVQTKLNDGKKFLKNIRNFLESIRVRKKFPRALFGGGNILNGDHTGKNIVLSKDEYDALNSTDPGTSMSVELR